MFIVSLMPNLGTSMEQWKKPILAFLIIISGCAFSFSQEDDLAKIDSLLAKSSTQLAVSSDSSLKYAFLAAEQSLNSTLFCKLVQSYRAIANAYKKSDDADNTIFYFEKALKSTDQCNDKTNLDELTFDLAYAHYSKGSYDQAELLLRQAKKMAEKSSNEKILFNSYNYLGKLYLVFYTQYVYSAFYYFNMAMHSAENMHDSTRIAEVYCGLSGVYERLKQWEKSIEYLSKAIVIYEKTNNPGGLSDAYKGMGDICWNKKQNLLAIDYYKKAYDICKQEKNATGISFLACDLAYMYAAEKNTALLNKYADESYKIAVQTKSWRTIKYAGFWLSEAYEMVGNYEKALFYHKKYFAVNDSINNRERIEKTSRSGIQEDFEEKIVDMKIEQGKRNAIAKEREDNQRIVRNILIVGLIVASLLLFLVYRSYIQKKKANVIIRKQKEETENQKIKIEEKNKEITDSIHYAEYIQQSILPDPKEVMKVFPNSFVLYKPKDVVSGDFYWFSKQASGGMIVAADCTGHGVPGALMSMLGNDKLNQAITNNISNPGDILSFVNSGIKTTLKQNHNIQTSQDGMDIALLSFEFKIQGSKMDIQSPVKLLYAGANRPLWHVRNGNLTEYKATKACVGGSTPENQKFITQEILLEKEDTLYVFTDGYAAQFGGGNGKKLMKKNMKDFILSIQHIPILEQKVLLNKKLIKWQGALEQVDDILVIGIKV